MNLYGGSDAGIAGPGFDVLKLFHLYKPNYSWVSETNGRQQNGDRNPTLSSHSGDTGAVHILAKVTIIGTDQQILMEVLVLQAIQQNQPSSLMWVIMETQEE